MDLVFTCKCGHREPVSPFAVGMTTRCPACGARVQVTAENTAAPQPAPEVAPPGVAQPVRPAAPERCARCGKPFRGDWDRRETNGGVLCLICADVAVPRPPEPGRQWTAKRAEPDASREAAAKPETGPRPWFNPESPTFKAVILLLAIGVMASAAYMLLAEGFEISIPERPVARPASEASAPAADQLRRTVPLWIITAIGFGFTLLGMGAAFYLTLRYSWKLPYNGFLVNAGYCLGLGFALYMWNFVVWTAGMYAVMGPGLYVTGKILTLMGLWLFFEDWRDILVFFVVYALTAIMAWALTQLAYGAIALAVL